eukprot:TRINITY_DN3355_c0_g1_i1.p1 TRINITY_DN3355_c0_g1~~TRINITY_DN3355_c0_g1_i1.p1  ORF type:complete len:412 (-),score=105.64 TRINITY_DN3355_c0_g1_i1:46-1197(-)
METPTKSGREQSKMMTKEEEQEMESMIVQRRSRGMAFYDKWAAQSTTVTPTVKDPPLFKDISSSTQHSGLSEPNSSNVDPRIHCHSSRLRIGFADTIGKRPTMEDEIVIAGRLRGHQDEDLILLFDGHGGKSASEYAAKHLHSILVDKMKSMEPEEALRESFITTNENMRADAVKGGTTAIAAYFYKSKLYIANAGDSRAVLSRDNRAYRLSKDHKPEDPQEEARVVAAGGVVIKINNTKLGRTIGRVNGMLAVSRALGDFFLQPCVTPVPEVRTYSPAGDLLIIACDGVWDVLSDSEAIDIANSELDPEIAATKVRDAAINKHSADNVSVVVIRLPAAGCPDFPDLEVPADPDGQIWKRNSVILILGVFFILFGVLRSLQIV